MQSSEAMASARLAPEPSQRALAMPASPIRRSFMAARRLEESGADVIRLDIGDPDFELPEHYAAAVFDAIRAGRTHYSPVAGISELRQAISKHMLTRFGHQISPEQVVVNQGATQGLNAAQLFCCSPGDTIVLPEVYWPNYLQQIWLAGLRVDFYALDDRFQPRLDDFQRLSEAAAHAGSRIAAILVNSPSNPTGALFPLQTLEAIYSFAAEQRAWIISDEAYCDYVFQGDYCSALAIDLAQPESERRVLTVYSGSKSYAATGMRVGWTVAPTVPMAARLGLLNEPLTGSITTPLQFGLAAAVAVEDCADRREALRSRWKLTGEMLRQAGLPFDPPAGGLFYFVDVAASGLDATAFADRLLAQQHVAVVAGNGFGLRPTAETQDGFTSSELAARHVRLCFAVPEDRLVDGLGRIVKFVQECRG